MRPYTLVAIEPVGETSTISLEVFDLDRPVGEQAIYRLAMLTHIEPARVPQRLPTYLYELVRSLLGRLESEREVQAHNVARAAATADLEKPNDGQPYQGKRHGLYRRD